MPEPITTNPRLALVSITLKRLGFVRNESPFAKPPNVEEEDEGDVRTQLTITQSLSEPWKRSTVSIVIPDNAAVILAKLMEDKFEEDDARADKFPATPTCVRIFPEGSRH